MSREIYRPAGEALGPPQQAKAPIWALAPVVGVLAAVCCLLLGLFIDYLQFLIFGAPRGQLAARLGELPWWGRLSGPIVGGAILCLVLRAGMSMGWGPSPRPFGLQDVIQHRRLRARIGSTTLSLRDAFLSGLITLVSLGSGASAGREEPLGHMGASLGLFCGRVLGLDLPARRMLLGMGLAAAISAALDAPVAGMLLARELALRPLRLSQMGPVAAASVTAWWIVDWQRGGRPVIDAPGIGSAPPEVYIAALAALPVLTLAAYAAALTFARLPILASSAASRINMPVWLLPVAGGALLGIIALAVPEALGIGYETLTLGLGGTYGPWLMVLLAIAKLCAAGVTLAFRWGGGLLAPMLFICAMIGSSLAVPAGMLLGVSAPAALFGMLGMAVGAAVLLDAPLTAGILVLELSGSTEAGAAGLLAAYMACMAVRRFAPAPAHTLSQPISWR